MACETPARLAEKLVQIRLALDLSQEGIIRRLGVAKKITRDDISKYERGARQPSLLLVLEYARVAKVPMEVLVDEVGPAQECERQVEMFAAQSKRQANSLDTSQ